jgi:Right handed beta helix region
MDNSTLKPSFGFKSIIQGFTAVILLISLVVPLGSGQALPNPPGITFSVNTDSDLGDAAPGDGACSTTTGTCSLRAAIDEMNALGTGGVIDFFDNYTINLTDTIFLATNNITLTGSSHAITIVGPSTSSSVALWLAGDGGLVEYLTVKNPVGYAIYIDHCDGLCPSFITSGSNYIVDHVNAIGSAVGIGIVGDNNTVQNSYIGVTESTLSSLVDPSDCVEDERNTYGIYEYDAVNTLIQNNQILCNSIYGIEDAFTETLIITGNTLSGNGRHGIDLNGTNSALIQGNYIGNLAGTIIFPNNEDGIRLEVGASNIKVGGSGATDGNIISGNSQFGIFIQDGTTNVLVDRNLIGLDSNHDPLPNYFGVSVSSASHVTIGSNNHALYQQFISSNRYGGISIGSSDDVTILDNTLIGLASWTSDNAPDDPAGNGWDGISISDSTNVTVESWKIAYSEWSGIYVQGASSLHNTFLPKNIYSNGRLSIDLEPYGFTPNDPGDTDSGPNDLLNYPEITGVNGNNLSGTVCAGCTVYFYQAKCNPGFNGGGGSTISGLLPATADESGVWQTTLPAGIQPWNITMLTYDSETNQTSEFSPVYTTFIPLTLRP